MRVFLDTNVLISAFATRGLGADVVNLVLAEHQLVLGESVLREFSRVLGDKMGASAQTTKEAVAFLRANAVVVSDAPDLGITVRDADDEAVLNEAVAGLAEVLVTGDKDLLELTTRAPVRILNPRGFWELVRSTGDEQ